MVAFRIDRFRSLRNLIGFLFDDTGESAFSNDFCEYRGVAIEGYCDNSIGQGPLRPSYVNVNFSRQLEKLRI